MSYTRVNWQNKPSTATPINATNLNHMDAGIAANDAAIGTLNTAVQGKVDKVEGKGLSTNDFTDEDALKLAGIEDGAEVNVQADWDEADNTADDYIKNKPDLGVYAEKDSLWSDATASGNPVTIKTQSAQTAKSTVLSMLPVQDLHGYGKPWVGGAGKNLLQLNSHGSNYNITPYGIEVSDYDSANSYYIMQNVKGFAVGTYTVNDYAGGGSASTHRLRVYKNGESIGYASENKFTFTVNSVEDVIDIRLYTYEGNTTQLLKPQIEAGSNTTSYEPYANICPITGRTGAEIVVKDEDDVTQDTVTISFGQTVYGGTLNVETGVLTVDRAIVDLGLLTYTQQDTGLVQTTKNEIQTVTGSNPKRSANTDLIMDAWTGYDTANDTRVYTDILATNFAAAASGHYLCFPLETPTTTTLTAAQVNLLKGLNNVSTDADGISITYFADGESLTDADNRITAVLGDIATVEGARASQNYAIGDYLVFNDKFCKASAAIATGEALAIGTNLTQTTIGAELKAILAQL